MARCVRCERSCRASCAGVRSLSIFLGLIQSLAVDPSWDIAIRGKLYKNYCPQPVEGRARYRPVRKFEKLLYESITNNYVNPSQNTQWLIQGIEQSLKRFESCGEIYCISFNQLWNIWRLKHCLRLLTNTYLSGGDVTGKATAKEGVSAATGVVSSSSKNTLKSKKNVVKSSQPEETKATIVAGGGPGTMLSPSHMYIPDTAPTMYQRTLEEILYATNYPVDPPKKAEVVVADDDWPPPPPPPPPQVDGPATRKDLDILDSLMADLLSLSADEPVLPPPPPPPSLSLNKQEQGWGYESGTLRPRRVGPPPPPKPGAASKAEAANEQFIQDKFASVDETLDALVRHITSLRGFDLTKATLERTLKRQGGNVYESARAVKARLPSWVVENYGDYANTESSSDYANTDARPALPPRLFPPPPSSATVYYPPSRRADVSHIPPPPPPHAIGSPVRKAVSFKVAGDPAPARRGLVPTPSFNYPKSSVTQPQPSFSPTSTLNRPAPSISQAATSSNQSVSRPVVMRTLTPYVPNKKELSKMKKLKTYLDRDRKTFTHHGLERLYEEACEQKNLKLMAYYAHELTIHSFSGKTFIDNGDDERKSIHGILKFVQDSLNGLDDESLTSFFNDVLDGALKRNQGGLYGLITLRCYLAQGRPIPEELMYLAFSNSHMDKGARILNGGFKIRDAAERINDDIIALQKVDDLVKGKDLSKHKILRQDVKDYRQLMESLIRLESVVWSNFEDPSKSDRAIEDVLANMRFDVRRRLKDNRVVLIPQRIDDELKNRSPKPKAYSKLKGLDDFPNFEKM